MMVLLDNFAFQLFGVCGGFIALFFLWQNRPEDEPERGSAVERHR